MKACMILIPLVEDTSREPHPKDRWLALERAIIDHCGGITRGPNVSGAWVDDEGALIEDESREYRFATDSEEVAFHLARFACSRFDQQCIYLQVGVEVYLVNAI